MVTGLNAEPRKSKDPFAAFPISVGSSVGYEIQEFLAWEALLLDHRRYAEWSALLAKDLVYRCLGRPDEESSYNFTLRHLRRQPEAAAQATSGHTHRFLSNVIVAHGIAHEEFAVSSYVLINYALPGEAILGTFAVERRDYLRRATCNTFRLMRRDIRMGLVSVQIRESVGPV